MLYLIATPIGNFGDISFRAVKTLKECDYLYAEDTRRTAGLLSHLGIEKKLLSFHSFNEKKREDEIVQRLQAGKTVGIVSDAGMPVISDPGASLINRLQKENLSYSVIPGPSAVIAAMALSGSLSTRFQFLGFIPKKSGEAKRFLRDALEYPGLSIFFDTPHRLEKSLGLMNPGKEVIVIREISKIYEEVLKKSAEELLIHFQNHPPKGEIVVLIEGADCGRPKISFEEALSLLTPYMSELKARRIAKKLVGDV